MSYISLRLTRVLQNSLSDSIYQVHKDLIKSVDTRNSCVYSFDESMKKVERYIFKRFTRSKEIEEIRKRKLVTKYEKKKKKKLRYGNNKRKGIKKTVDNDWFCI